MENKVPVELTSYLNLLDDLFLDDYSEESNNQIRKNNEEREYWADSEAVSF